MFVTIIASHYCTVNRKNAIVLLTEYQKYYGIKLLYQRCLYALRGIVFYGCSPKSEFAGSARCRYSKAFRKRYTRLSVHLFPAAYCCKSEFRFAFLFILALSIVLLKNFAGRGARMREGQPKKEGRRSFVAYLPSLLGFPSRALLFLTLSPLFGSAYAFGSRSIGG